MAGIIMFKHHSVDIREKEDGTEYFVPQFFLAANAEGFQKLSDYFAERAAMARALESQHAEALASSADPYFLEDEHVHLDLDDAELREMLEGHDFSMRVGHQTEYTIERDRKKFGYDQPVYDLAAHYRHLLTEIDDELDFQRRIRDTEDED
jgi:hypothetical protein